MTVPESLYFPDPELADEDGLLVFGGEFSPDTVLDALIHGIFPWPITLADEEEFFVDDEGQEQTFGEWELEENRMGQDKDRLNNEKNVGSNSFLNRSDPRVQNAVWEGRTPFSLLSLRESRSALAWWSPNPRAIIDLENIHIPRRLKRTMNGKKFIVTYDQAFPEVMIACATSGMRDVEGTWITREFYEVYCRLHELGFAHSVECWQDNIDNTSDDQAKYKLVGGLYG
ncbi:MAG: hypothetical protein J6X44_14530, partial [Thermoguttaceae bacterium]|nr:hypothetical protein [Thermoguttaceae bacterium]